MMQPDPSPQKIGSVLNRVLLGWLFLIVGLVGCLSSEEVETQQTGQLLTTGMHLDADDLTDAFTGIAFEETTQRHYLVLRLDRVPRGSSARVNTFLVNMTSKERFHIHSARLSDDSGLGWWVASQTFRPPDDGQYAVVLSAERFSSTTPPLHFRVAILHSVWSAAALRLGGAIAVTVGGLLLIARRQSMIAKTAFRMGWLLIIGAGMTVVYARVSLFTLRPQTLDALNRFWMWLRI